MDGSLGQMAETYRNARIGLGLKGFGRMVAHFDDLGRVYDVETLSRTPLGSQHGFDPLPVAEQHDPALRVHGPERHDGTLHRSLGSEIAAHGIHTNL